MKSPVKIMQADAGDIPLLRELGVQTFTETFAHQNNPEDFQAYLHTAFSSEQLQQEFNEPGSIFLLAYVKNEPAGYARLRHSNELDKTFPGKKCIELQRIYAVQKFIGKGVGKALMTSCTQLAQQQHANLLWLGVWEHNHHAISFYKRIGFEPFDTHVFMMGTDPQTDILMKLNFHVS
jgi:GNAT superfamily N-acetyltransferase